MQFFALVAFFSLAIAMPTQQETTNILARSNDQLCPYRHSPQCCSTVVSGAVNISCDYLDEAGSAGNSFKEICAKTGKQAACCSDVLFGPGILCTAAIS